MDQTVATSSDSHPGFAKRAVLQISLTGDIYGHPSDPTTRAAIDRLTSTLGL